MERERWIKNTTIVFSEIVTKLMNPSFRFSKGGATIKTLDKFLDLFEKEFGAITQERLVDFCICTAYAYRDRDQWTIKQIFGPSSIKRMSENKHGTEYYQDKWLATRSLSRGYLISLIIDKSKHPLAKYIYMHSEENTKMRCHNQEIGYMICQNSTLGYSPLSEACKSCDFVEECKNATRTKYQELYRIRIEYGKSNE